MKIQGETALCAFVQFEDVTKIYKTGDVEVKALSGASFEIQKGEFCVIVGESGAGKTTLLNILGGMDTLTTGRVRMDGVEISGFDRTKLENYRRFDIGFVFQFYNLIPVLSAQENIALPVMLDGQRVNDQELAEVMRMLGLEQRKDHLPSQLSGGQQQRVSIGRALINAPSVVLADEPTGNLDRKNSQEIVELLKYSNRQYGQTLIVITHDESIALQADRVLAIEDGHIVRDEVIRK